MNGNDLTRITNNTIISRGLILNPVLRDLYVVFHKTSFTNYSQWVLLSILRGEFNEAL